MAKKAILGGLPGGPRGAPTLAGGGPGHTNNLSYWWGFPPVCPEDSFPGTPKRAFFGPPPKRGFSGGGVAPGPPLQGTAGQATRTPHKIGDREDDPTAFFSAVIDYL